MSKNSSFKIGSREIGLQSPVFVIAELSANHNHNLQAALDTISAARDCGADAVKFQTYTADTITIDSNQEWFKIQKGTLWDGKTLYQLYKEAYTPWEWHPKLFDHAKQCGLIAFSSPFDPTAVDLLEELNVPLYKVASFEITDIPLIEYVAAKKKPVIISTGIATQSEIQEAVDACMRSGNETIVLLKCTSAYPAPFSEVNLHTIPDLRDRFGVIAGLSDHTTGVAVPIGAVALGAKVIEKHIILDRKMGGPDSEFSLEPAEFKEMIDRVREVEAALGSITYDLSPKIQKSREFSRSLFVVEDIKAGELLTKQNIRSIRPGNGLAPKLLPEVLGKTACRDLKRGTPLQIGMYK